MSTPDTSAEAVARLLAQLEWQAASRVGFGAERTAAATLEALAAERDAAIRAGEVMQQQRDEALARAERAEAELAAYAGPRVLRPKKEPGHE